MCALCVCVVGGCGVYVHNNYDYVDRCSCTNINN